MERYKADKILTSEALKRVIAPDSSFGERAAALAVSAALKAKTSLTKFGSGMCNQIKNMKKKNKSTGKRKKKIKANTKIGGSICLGTLIKNAKAAVKNSKPKTLNDAITTALKSVKNSRKGRQIKAKRVIPIPKTGGVLPLIPILAGLSAVGSLAHSAVGIARSLRQINDVKSERPSSPIKVGNGLYLAPYKTGNGLYLSPYKTSGDGLYLRPYSKN